MERLFEHLRPVLRAIIHHPVLLLLGAILLSIGSGLYAYHLRIDSDFARLIPESYHSAQALEKLRQNVGGESEAAIVIESPSFEANKKFAEALIPRMLELQGQGRKEPYFSRVDYKKDVSFLQNNALYFATNDELDSLESFLNNQIEESRLKANPFYFDVEDEEDTTASTDSTAAQLAQVYERLVGKEYPVNEDSTIMVLRFYPTGAQTDVSFISDAYADMGKLIASLNPASFHPAMKTTLAGRLLRQKIEVETITNDVTSSFGAGVLAVLLLVASYFFYKSYQARAGRRFSRRILFSELSRIPVTMLVIGLPLLAAILWTGGVTYLVYEKLNMMTSTLALVLFGLGIDYGIHFYARYAEERGSGLSMTEAIERTFMSTGQAITATSATTAAAFYILMIADFRGFSEFGFIAGTGIVFALLAMLVMLPALIVLFEKTGLLNLTAMHAVEHASSAPLETGRNHHAPRAVKVSRVIVVTSLVLLAGAIWTARGSEFEYDFGKLDPVYDEYNQLNAKVRTVHNDRGMRNPAYIVVDDPAEVPAIDAAIRLHMANDSTPTIRTVESMQARFPMTPVAAQAKLARIDSIRTLLADPFLASADSRDLDRLRQAASTKRPISLAEVPAELKKTFTAKDGSIGRFVVIYPSVGLSNGKNSINFSEDIGTIKTAEGKVYHAGSTSLVAADMLRLMQREAPLMVGLTILLIIGMKLIILRNLKWTMMALIPLVVGFTWMFGLMAIFGMKLNFYNLVVLPTVLGIGDDAGIHLVHRYLEEGKGSIGRVLRSTGEHITMSAVTAGMGFAGQLLSFYPGLRSMGDLAVMGIGLTLLTALVMLPAMLRWFEYSRPTSAPEVHNHAA